MPSSIYDIPVRKMDGSDATLAEKQGKVMLIVNVASKCGLTPQYEGLEQLYRTYRDQGFEVLGFPANNFLGQEPGSDAEIQDFCRMTFSVDFPLYSKISVVGEDQHPLYAFLTEQAPVAENKGDTSFQQRLAEIGQVPQKPNDILWNFEKFLVGRDGRIAGRFSPGLVPTDPIIVQAIEAELNRQRASV